MVELPLMPGGCEFNLLPGKLVVLMIFPQGKSMYRPPPGTNSTEPVNRICANDSSNFLNNGVSVAHARAANRA